MLSSQVTDHKNLLSDRLRRFLTKPWPAKLESARFRWQRLLGSVPVPVRLPFGCWWVAWKDKVSPGIVASASEMAELRFVERFLRPGMTVLDVGAHHGLYTLLASKQVGPRGRVIAFEPSSRERRKLALHLWLNTCSNVQIEEVALGAAEGQAEFFRVDSGETGCNSLRPPAVEGPVSTLHVRVECLGEFLRRRHLDSVDFVKLDVEGAELEVLRGAAWLLTAPPRPVMLIEVSDLRTEPWGYAAPDIVAFLEQRGFRWFQALSGGQLCPMVLPEERLDTNFVAVPEERLTEVRHLLAVAG